MKKKIGVLLFTRSDSGEVERASRLLEEIKFAGYQSEIFYSDLFSVYFEKNRLEIFYDNKQLVQDDFKFFLPRYSITRYEDFSLARFLEQFKIKIFNSPDSAFLAKNKRDSLTKLVLKNIPVTPTGINYSPFFLDKHLERNKNNNIVVKCNTGSLGDNVARLDSQISFISFMEFTSGIFGAQNLLIQPFINSGSEDYRIIVVGNKVIAGMKRKAKGIEFRANISKGGNGEKIKVDKKMADLSIRATRVLGLDFAGVDIIKDKNGNLFILEVNCNPMLGIEQITGENIARAIIKHGIKMS